MHEFYRSSEPMFVFGPELNGSNEPGRAGGFEPNGSTCFVWFDKMHVQVDEGISLHEVEMLGVVNVSISSVCDSIHRNEMD